MADITSLINYYVNLLIIQYQNQPKAQATINLFAQEMLAAGIMTDIEQAYDIDTAVGVQLDVIGKYVGVDRYFAGLNLINYFSLITYSEVTSPPASPTRWGFTDYAGFGNFDYNGTLVYSEIITVQNALFDDDYRTLIRLKILEDNSNYSHSSIDTEMAALFATSIHAESTGNMTMYYFVSSNLTSLIQAIIAKKLLPKPMGVLLYIVSGVTGQMFALTDYTGYQSPYGYGFTDYTHYATLTGEVLTYSQISAG